jgi:nitrate/TMAO reductase-like tetraheme cytochrome c subunit
MASTPTEEMEPVAETAPVPPKGLRKLWWRLSRTTIDLGNRKHRRNVILGFAGLFLVAVALLVGGLEIVHFTESSEFCGEICHPMDPTYLRYELSPHVNVECAACHVGPGVAAFVKSKLAGTKELFALVTNTYHRPIKSPVHSLRPASVICEQCHTPTSFRDNVIKIITHYDDDEANTAVRTAMILKTGGWQESTGVSQGIHWHTTNPVYYIAADEQRQVIMWVGTEQPDGTLKEYYSRDMLNMPWESFLEEARAEDKVRLLDCIDCHNRAAHLVPPPSVAVDEAIEAGLISTDLPYIRAKAVEVLTPVYESREEAQATIEGLVEFYRKEYPEVFASRRSEVEAAIEGIKAIDASTKFPEEKMDWQTNPNNVRHNPTEGCFRCHDGKHVSMDAAGNEAGVISVKCNLCHTVPIVGRGDETLMEAPVLIGAPPDSHADFRWTIEHRAVTEAEQSQCFTCHGRGFCNNGVCHDLSHPPDMMFTHAEEYKKAGNQVCYVCHQDVLCSRCHPGGIIRNP